MDGTVSEPHSLGREGINMAATGTATSTEKGRRIVGTERQTLAKDLVKRYTAGESIRASGGIYRPLVRVRAPCAHRVRRAAAAAGRRTAPQEGVTRPQRRHQEYPGRPVIAETTGVADCDGPVATGRYTGPMCSTPRRPAMWQASATCPGTCRAMSGSSSSAARDAPSPPASTCRSPVAGPGSFAELARCPGGVRRPDRRVPGGFTWLHRPDVVTIAAVQGHAIGAGFQLALACDMRILADDARLSMAEVTLGLVPDLAGTKRLVELVGYSRALEICATGRRIDAGEADRIGLATLVVPPELDGAVRDLAAGLLAGNRDAVVEIKALLAGAAAVRTPSSSGPNGRRRPAGCGTWPARASKGKDRSGRSGLLPRLS